MVRSAMRGTRAPPPYRNPWDAAIMDVGRRPVAIGRCCCLHETPGRVFKAECRSPVIFACVTACTSRTAIPSDVPGQTMTSRACGSRRDMGGDISDNPQHYAQRHRLCVDKGTRTSLEERRYACMMKACAVPRTQTHRNHRAARHGASCHRNHCNSNRTGDGRASPDTPVRAFAASAICTS
ncbi:hypothetical protein C8Q70DRAFT_461981 [Cubamyces menziesii]|nr:hypothetical protein C8Q70DRAFT_461981 [Cubamyces menziesii]